MSIFFNDFNVASHINLLLHVQTFKKRAGATDQGKEFEHLYIAKILLNLITDEEIKNFYISSNDASFGSFDDVVIEIEHYSKAENEIFACQLKQKQSNKRVLTREALSAPSGNFSIKKYYEDFKKTDNLHGPVKMVLLTNSKTPITGKIELNFGEEPFHVDILEHQQSKYLTTANEGSCYGFIANQFNNFFEIFLLYTGQASVERIKYEIQNTLRNIFDCDESIFQKYFTFICDWSMKEGTKIKLEKSMMKQVITMCVLSPYIKPISFSSTPVNKRGQLLREAISKFDTTVLEEISYKEIKKLWEDVVCGVDNFEKINKIRQKYQLKIKCIENVEDLSVENKEMSKLMWLLEKCPIVVEECAQTSRAIDFCIGAKFVVLSGNGNKTNDPRVFQTLADLKSKNDIFDKILYNFKYSLEGQKEATLQSLLDICPEIESMVTSDQLLRMVDHPLLIGKEKEVLPPCHLSRKLTKIVIKTQYLRETTTDTLILINCVRDSDNLKQCFKNIQKKMMKNFTNL